MATCKPTTNDVQLRRLLDAVELMDREIRQIGGYGKIFGHLADSPHEIEGELVAAIGNDLSRAQSNLQVLWQQASEAGQFLQKSFA
ncbi:hypothetical protein [Methylobacterium ajmalii]|jgi:hypothetical protein|uniref:hypothetical protein n=1 Tax=Methylobacterium ajmalii TaxID=2738439 RepID=UPI00190E36D0|nr:hypothetical protein [Methylobacterium ajmalii]MBK3398922.1 hypothetical protein [Methylobacterium ajmalii]MBK3409579.1 hypothetical protein [Methylobacterium ajmalii]MBK3425686.1 hypothetical protein [Methylobacterium ajmalii]